MMKRQLKMKMSTKLNIDKRCYLKTMLNTQGNGLLDKILEKERDNKFIQMDPCMKVGG